MWGEEVKQKTWLIISDGKSVKNHGIDISTLAKLCQNLQHIYDSIGDSRYGNDYKKDECRLYLKASKEAL